MPIVTSGAGKIKTGTLGLNKNQIYDGVLRSALFNMIISQQVYDLNVTPNTKLLDMVTDEVAGYGDKKLFYFTDVLKSRDFIAGINDGTNQNVLATHRPEDITIQEIVLDKVRQIEVTTDDFLTKLSFQAEGAFSQLMSVFMNAMSKTKQVHLATLVNTFVGTDKNKTANKSTVYLNVDSITDKVEKGTEIAEGIANLMTDLSDVSRDFTDDKYLRSFDGSQLMVVYNAKYANMIKKSVLPYLYNTEGIAPDAVVTLPERYFGTVSSATSSVANARTLVEIEVDGVNYFPGDVLPTGTTVAANSTYVADDKIICKVIGKGAIKMLTAFNTTESFRNARAHNTNTYMAFGYSYPEHLVDFPVIEVRSDNE